MRPMPQLVIETVDIDQLNENPLNSKQHPHEQIDQIAESIEQFGNCDPIGVWTNPEGELVIVEGHGRYMALKMLGIRQVPVIRLDHLTDEQRRAYGLIHNKTTMNSDFDIELLKNELDLVTSIDMESFGFDIDFEVFSPEFGDAEDMKWANEGVLVKVMFHSQGLYDRYRYMFSEMEDGGASVSIS